MRPFSASDSSLSVRAGLGQLAQAGCARYRDSVNRHVFRRIVYGLVALQLLLAAPLASALAQGAGMGAATVATPAASESEPCDCCAENVPDFAACLITCGAAAAPPPTVMPVLSSFFTEPVPQAPFVSHAQGADPPLNPPPIA